MSYILDNIPEYKRIKELKKKKIKLKEKKKLCSVIDSDVKMQTFMFSATLFEKENSNEKLSNMEILRNRIRCVHS